MPLQNCSNIFVLKWFKDVTHPSSMFLDIWTDHNGNVFSHQKQQHILKQTTQMLRNASSNIRKHTGNYSCLKVDLIFTRDRAFYFTTVFIPGIILVTSSFITFWLEWNAVPARSMIGNFVKMNKQNAISPWSESVVLPSEWRRYLLLETNRDRAEGYIIHTTLCLCNCCAVLFYIQLFV